MSGSNATQTSLGALRSEIARVAYQLEPLIWGDLMLVDAESGATREISISELMLATYVEGRMTE